MRIHGAKDAFADGMDETRLAEEFLLRMQAGEFDGRLYETIEQLSEEELRQIVALARVQMPRPLSELSNPTPWN